MALARRSSRSAARPAPRPRSRCANRSPRALVLQPGGDDAAATTVDAEIRTSSTSRSSSGRRASKVCSTYAVVPNFRTLGPRLGKLMPRSRQLLAEADGGDDPARAGRPTAVRPRRRRRRRPTRARRRRGPRRAHEEFALAEDGGIAVALDLDARRRPRAEGHARELVRALNDLRKARASTSPTASRFDCAPTATCAAAVTAHRDWIAGEVLAAESTVHARGGTSARKRGDYEPIGVGDASSGSGSRQV